MNILAVDKKSPQIAYPCLVINKQGTILFVINPSVDDPTKFNGMMLRNEEGHAPYFFENFTLHGYALYDGKVVLENN